MSQEDLQYYRERAITERNRAATAPSPAIAAAHDKLAIMYQNLVERLERSQPAQDLQSPARIAQLIRSEAPE
jgi:hypothetical protein